MGLQISRGGSQIGRLPNMDRGRAAKVVSIDREYFCHLPCHANVQPSFDENKFRRGYRASRDVFKNVRKGLLSDWRDTYLQQRPGTCGLLGASTGQKMTAAFRALACGNSTDIIDEYGRLGESSYLECLMIMCHGIVDLLDDERLWLPREDELQRISREYAEMGFPGRWGAVDCASWFWDACPTAWAGQCRGKENSRTSGWRFFATTFIASGGATLVRQERGMIYKYLTSCICLAIFGQLNGLRLRRILTLA
jgi:hypothetical protein